VVGDSAQARNLSLLQDIHTGYGVHPHLCYGYSLNVWGSSRFCTACGMQHPDQFSTAGRDYHLMGENLESCPEVGRTGGGGG
jgi:hypothetical protein